MLTLMRCIAKEEFTKQIESRRPVVCNVHGEGKLSQKPRVKKCLKKEKMVSTHNFAMKSRKLESEGRSLYFYSRYLVRIVS